MYMKTISTNFYSLLKAFVLLASIGYGTAKAQAPFQGGVTYYVNGVGNDVAGIKDTFANLMGPYSGGAYGNSTGIFNALTVSGLDPNRLHGR